MKKENDNLLEFCRYYHGEKTCKSTDKDVQMLFNIERIWIDRMTSEESNFEELLDEYVTFGLTEFCETDDVPVTLKALLFNRFSQYNDRIDFDAFNTWYKKHYD